MSSLRYDFFIQTTWINRCHVIKIYGSIPYFIIVRLLLTVLSCHLHAKLAVPNLMFSHVQNNICSTWNNTNFSLRSWSESSLVLFITAVRQRIGLEHFGLQSIDLFSCFPAGPGRRCHDRIHSRWMQAGVREGERGAGAGAEGGGAKGSGPADILFRWPMLAHRAVPSWYP